MKLEEAIKDIKRIRVKDNVGVILGWLGMILIALGFIIGFFMLHWVLGLIASGLALLVLAGFVLSDENDF